MVTRPPDVDPAEFEAAMRPEAADPWEPMPHAIGYWLASDRYGWLGPFPNSNDVWDRAAAMPYVDDWQVVKIAFLSSPIFDHSPL